MRQLQDLGFENQREFNKSDELDLCASDMKYLHNICHTLIFMLLIRKHFIHARTIRPTLREM